MFDQHLIDGFYLVLFVSGVPMLISALGGFLVAVVQTATQIQEQSLSHIVKFALVSVVLLIAGSYFLDSLVIFFEESVRSMAHLGRLS